jgi:hypothetical protein
MSEELTEKISIIGLWTMAVAVGTFCTYIIIITR